MSHVLSVYTQICFAQSRCAFSVSGRGQFRKTFLVVFGQIVFNRHRGTFIFYLLYHRRLCLLSFAGETHT